jgi:hypothetical protein
MIRYLLVLLTCISINSIAQETESTRIYEIRSNIPAYACDVTGQVLDMSGRFQVPPYRSKFALVRNAADGRVVIRFLSWRRGSFLWQQYNRPVPISEVNNPLVRPSRGAETDSVARYFLISRGDLDSNCIKTYARLLDNVHFTLGLVTMPLKLRLGSDFSFHGNLSLGTTAGAKMRISKYNPNYVNFLFGASIGTVDLDSFNTRGKVTGQPLTNMAVFSPSLGIVFEFGKAQAGVFYGWDFLAKSNQVKYGWIYHKKPWISVGFGFSIFNIDSKTSTSKEGDQTPPPGNSK